MSILLRKKAQTHILYFTKNTKKKESFFHIFLSLRFYGFTTQLNFFSSILFSRCASIREIFVLRKKKSGIISAFVSFFIFMANEFRNWNALHLKNVLRFYLLEFIFFFSSPLFTRFNVCENEFFLTRLSFRDGEKNSA